MDQNYAMIQRRQMRENYRVLERLVRFKTEHDEIMSHIEKTGITAEESSSYFYTRARSRVPPLKLAIEFGRLDLMNSLIQKGFHPDTPYKIRHTGDEKLFYLILEACKIGKVNVIKSLVEEHHVDLKVVDCEENTAVMTVLKNRVNKGKEKLDIVKYLVEKGADVTETAALATAVSLNMYEVSRYLISCGGLMGPKPPQFFSPLVYATKKANIAMIKLLVEAGAKIEGAEGRKVFLIAVVHNDVDMVEHCNSLNIDLDWEGELVPAIQIAIESEAYEVARYLAVDANVRLDRRGLANRTTFQLALDAGEVDFIRLLLQAGYNPKKETFFSERHNERFQQRIQLVQDFVAQRTLKDHCVAQVRKSLGKNANQKVSQLPLPTVLQKMVQLEDIPRTLDISVSSFPACMKRDQHCMILEQYNTFYERIISDTAPVQADGECSDDSES